MKLIANAWTEARLKDSLGAQPGYFKLYYDTEDCGCNGVLVLRIVDEPYPTDIQLAAEPFSFVVDGRQESLFDEVMRLEADPGYPSFRLVSDSSIISSDVRIRDERETAGRNSETL